MQKAAAKYRSSPKKSNSARELTVPVPSIQIYFHTFENHELSFLPHARWIAEIMAEVLGEPIEARGTGNTHWFSIGEIATIFYEDEMDYNEYIAAGMLA